MTLVRLFYSLGILAMLGAFPVWIVAVVVDDTTAGAVGMLTFLLGVLLTAVGAGMDYRAHVPDIPWATVEYAGQDGEPKRMDTDTEWPRP